MTRYTIPEDASRELSDLLANFERRNKKIKQQNAERIAAGEPLLPLIEIPLDPSSEADPHYQTLITNVQAGALDFFRALSGVSPAQIDRLALWALYQNKITLDSYATLNVLLTLADEATITKCTAHSAVLDDSEAAQYFEEVFLKSFPKEDNKCVADLPGAQVFQKEKLREALKAIPEQDRQFYSVKVQSNSLIVGEYEYDFFKRLRTSNFFVPTSRINENTLQLYIPHFAVLQAAYAQLPFPPRSVFRLGFTPHTLLHADFRKHQRVLALKSVASKKLGYYSNYHGIKPQLLIEVLLHDLLHLSELALEPAYIAREVDTMQQALLERTHWQVTQVNYLLNLWESKSFDLGWQVKTVEAALANRIQHVNNEYNATLYHEPLSCPELYLLLIASLMSERLMSPMVINLCNQLLNENDKLEAFDARVTDSEHSDNFKVVSYAGIRGLLFNPDSQYMDDHQDELVGLENSVGTLLELTEEEVRAAKAFNP